MEVVRPGRERHLGRRDVRGQMHARAVRRQRALVHRQRGIAARHRALTRCDRDRQRRARRRAVIVRDRVGEHVLRADQHVVVRRVAEGAVRVQRQLAELAGQRRSDRAGKIAVAGRNHRRDVDRRIRARHIVRHHARDVAGQHRHRRTAVLRRRSVRVRRRMIVDHVGGDVVGHRAAVQRVGRHHVQRAEVRRLRAFALDRRKQRLRHRHLAGGPGRNRRTRRDVELHHRDAVLRADDLLAAGRGGPHQVGEAGQQRRQRACVQRHMEVVRPGRERHLGRRDVRGQMR
ncbi:hypothetical protein chiPu_0029151, partial [Chiloscyllium punctatum]|nr:hypothetical protein [Chiloscyllium punctatum]